MRIFLTATARWELVAPRMVVAHSARSLGFNRRRMVTAGTPNASATSKTEQVGPRKSRVLLIVNLEALELLMPQFANPT